MSTFSVLPLGAIRPEGWIRRQMLRDLDEGFAGCLDGLTIHASNDLFSNRIQSSKMQQAWWDSESRGNWLWGYTLMAGLSENRSHRQRNRLLLEALKNTQDADGYLGIYSADSRYNHKGSENGELWGQSRALLPLLAYYELTGDGAYLKAVEKAVQLTLKQYAPHKKLFDVDNQHERDGYTGMTHALCYCDLLERLVDLTGKDEYRQFGLRLYRDFSALSRPFPNDDLALSNLLQLEGTFTGHAVHTAEHLRALLWAADQSDGPAWQEAVRNAFVRLEQYTLPSGALLGDEVIHGGTNPEIGYEYCTMTELLFSLASAVQKTGSRVYGDWMERLAFNAGQGARLANGKAIAYLSSDTRLEATASRGDFYTKGLPSGRFKYSPTHEDVACCCNPNAVRFMPHYVSRMWMELSDASGLAAAAYGPCRLSTKIGGTAVEIVEETAYPFSDEVTFTLCPEQDLPLTLILRRPAWAASARLDAPGAEAEESDGWIYLHKTWKRGDVVRVRFEPTLRTVPYASGENALFYGPLQYVVPIQAELHPTKEYPVAGFYDYDVLPSQPEAGIPLPESLTALRLADVTVEHIPGTDLDQPWEHSPIQLKHAESALVPIGCTILRQAAFKID